MASLSDFVNQKMSLQLVACSFCIKCFCSWFTIQSLFSHLCSHLQHQTMTLAMGGTIFLANCSCVCFPESNRKEQQFGACDNRKLCRIISAKISHFYGHNFIWKCIPLAIFHHLLITLRVAWKIFSIRNVKGFSTPLLFLGSHWLSLMYIVKSPSLDLYTNFKHSHSAPAYTVGEGVGEAVGDLIAFSDVM